MASTPKDANRVSGLLAGSNADAGNSPVVIYADPTTHRLLVDIDAADITSVTGVADGDAVNAANKGIILMGSDGSNYQAVNMDSSGNLSLSLVGSQSVALQQKVTSNDLIVTLDSESVAVTGTFYQATQPVSIATMPSTPVTGTFYQATQPVSLASVPSHAVTNAGTFATQIDGSALTALQLMDDVVYAEDAAHTTADKGAFILAVRNDGSAALTTTDLDYSPIAVTNTGKVMTATIGLIPHDVADSVDPIKVGMRAVDLGATPTAVAAADMTNWYANRAGIPFTLGGHPNTISKNLQITDADGAQTDTAIVTVAAGTAIVVTKCSVVADNANTVDVSCRIGFGTANTPAADAAGVILFHPGIAPGSGIVEGTGSGIIGIGASDEDLRVTCEDPVTGSISIIVTYFVIAIG